MMATPIVLNPKVGFTLFSTAMAAQDVTAATLEYGPTSGGPYEFSTQVPVALVTAGEGTGSIVVPLADIGLPQGVIYVVATLSNAAGASLISNEVGVQLLAVPTAPVLSVA
jgi:hypothetical protein